MCVGGLFGSQVDAINQMALILVFSVLFDTFIVRTILVSNTFFADFVFSQMCTFLCLGTCHNVVGG